MTNDPKRRLADLSPAKQALLRVRLQRSQQGDSQRDWTTSDQVSDNDFPLSFAQERVWLHQQHQPDSVVYNRPANIRLRGPLQFDSLRQALQHTVRRHQPLWTTIGSIHAAPRLLPESPAFISLPYTDLADRPDPQESADRIVAAEAAQPFDLSVAPLLRCGLLKVGEQDHLLMLIFHHIAFDAWSQSILLQELSAAYEAAVNGSLTASSKPQLRYTDFAAWDRSEERIQAFGESTDYWRGELGDLPVLQLPTDHPRPAGSREAAGQLDFEVPPQLVADVRALARENETTLFTVILATFQTLLFRYSGQQEIIIGCPVAGRNRVELEDLIGVFINTLPLRLRTSGNDSFRQLLDRTRQTVMDGLSHQQVPLQWMVQEMLSERENTGSWPFQVIFNHERPQLRRCIAAGVEFTPHEICTPATLVELSLELTETESQVDGRLTYQRELWEHCTIERMSDHFIALLESIVANPDQPLCGLPLLSEAERQQLLVDWNDTATQYPSNNCVHELFEQQVERSPNAVAVTFDDCQLTYRELNERANQLAQHLRSLGVGPETLVGLCLGRSPDLVIGILGILKAGGAYLPLDVDYPPARLAFMLQDASVEYLVTQQSLLDQLPSAGCRTVCLDTEEAQLGQLSQTNLSHNVGANSLAYVMYTSGSTGTPKGAAIEHRAIVRLVIDTNYVDLGPKDCIAQVSNISFDAATFEIWGALLNGSRLAIGSKEIALSTQEFANWLRRHRVTTLFLTTALFNQHVAAQSDIFAPLKQVLFGGEAVDAATVSVLMQDKPPARLLHVYGPTESTTFATWQLVEELNPVTVPIGRPIANTEVFVLDTQRNPVPIGVPGELYIGGAGLAREYLNRPELTAERFVANSLRDEPGERLYRTGDRCRWRADGTLEFLGRLDDQIKLRGYRIELGEIEALLKEHPDVAQGVVVLREDRPGDKRLVAYCVPVGDRLLNLDGLKSHLATRLPDYMIPNFLVVVESLPQTQSGKLDRRALPAPDDTREQLDTGYVAPVSPIEQQLASIWCDVLAINQIGIRDNFFALGGHSLLAMRLHARITSQWQVDLPLRKLFEAPTIAELAVEIQRLCAGSQSTPGLDLKRVARDQMERLPLSFPQQRLWILEQMEGELAAYNLPYVWRLRGTLNVEALRRALQAVLCRHEPLRTTFGIGGEQGEEPVQVINSIQRFELPLVNLESLEPQQQQQEIDSRCQTEAHKTFDLTVDPMLRASLLRLSDDEHLLLMTVHHIATDGWSMQVLWRELKALYEAECRGADLQLTRLPVQYADFAVWQRDQLRGQRVEQLLRYWSRQLQGISALELPTDRPRPSLPSYQGETHCIELSESLVDQLRRLSQSRGVTLQMTLLGAFQVLLARYSGQDDIAVGVPIAGRSHAQLENLIGFFINVHHIR